MTTYVNNYKPSDPLPRDLHLHTPPEEYDFNSCFPVVLLRSDRVELRPYVPSLHAQLLLDGILENPEIDDYLTTSFKELNDVLVWSETVCRLPISSLFYAIYTDQPGPDTPPTDPKDYVFAGVFGQINSSVPNATSEPGWIRIMKPFQRTHVLTHAAGLLMHRILDASSEGGLGLRRCQWLTTTLNMASQNAALRLGYKFEGVLRGVVVLPEGKKGVREGRKGEQDEKQMTRDTWVASIQWEEWEGGVREHVDKLMARRK
ncbi:hypothetical protein P7C73_g3067, partial [Tremellales sp. Uapishka_1]